MTREQIEQHDKRDLAAHEAAHLTVAVAKRVFAYAELEYLGGDGTEKTWTGRCHFLGKLGKHKAVISVAGVIAEHIDDHPSDRFSHIEDYISQGIISATDTAGLPKSRNKLFAACNEAARILSQHREYFDWATQKLIADERINQYEAWLRFYDAPMTRHGSAHFCAHCR